MEYRGAAVQDRDVFADQPFFPNFGWLPPGLAEARRPVEDRAGAPLGDPDAIPLSLPDDLDELLASVATLLQPEAGAAGEAAGPRQGGGGRGARLRRLWRGRRGAPAAWTVRVEGLVSDATATMASGFPALGAELSFSTVAGLGQTHEARPEDLPQAHVTLPEHWTIGADMEVAAGPVHPHAAQVIGAYAPAMAWAGDMVVAAGLTTARASSLPAAHVSAAAETGPGHAAFLADAAAAFPTFWHIGTDWIAWAGLQPVGLANADGGAGEAARAAARPPTQDAGSMAEPAAVTAAPAPHPATSASISVNPAVAVDAGATAAARPVETGTAHQTEAAGKPAETATVSHVGSLASSSAAAMATPASGGDHQALPAVVSMVADQLANTVAKALGGSQPGQSSASSHPGQGGAAGKAAADPAATTPAASDHPAATTSPGHDTDASSPAGHSGQGATLGTLPDALAAIPAAVGQLLGGTAAGKPAADTTTPSAAADHPAAATSPGHDAASSSSGADHPGQGAVSGTLPGVVAAIPAVVGQVIQGTTVGDTATSTAADHPAATPPGHDAASASSGTDHPGQSAAPGTLPGVIAAIPAAVGHLVQGTMAGDTATLPAAADHPAATPPGHDAAVSSTADHAAVVSATAAQVAGHATNADVPAGSGASAAIAQPPAALPEGGNALASAVPSDHPGQSASHGTPATVAGGTDLLHLSDALSAVAAGNIPALAAYAPHGHAADATGFLLPDALAALQDDPLQTAHPGELPPHAASGQESAPPVPPSDHILL